MKCGWLELLSILPEWLRPTVDRMGRENLQELRMRIGQPTQLVFQKSESWIEHCVTLDDLNFCVNTASRYSPWSAATASKGYLTARGGHRIGICGEAVIECGITKGFRRITSLCIRVSRDYNGIAAGIPLHSGSILILGKPGSGKTTLLRDLVRQKSESGQASITVIDERGELFPESVCRGKRTDVLTGCSKNDGIQMALRTMGPGCIAMDEITDEADADALLKAGWCGVDLLATAHAGSYLDFIERPIYRKLASSELFNTFILMQPDQTWRIERSKV